MRGELPVPHPTARIPTVDQVSSGAVQAQDVSTFPRVAPAEKNQSLRRTLDLATGFIYGVIVATVAAAMSLLPLPEVISASGWILMMAFACVVVAGLMCVVANSMASASERG